MTRTQPDPMPAPTPLAAPDAASPTAIEVRDLRKSFSIPTQRVDSLKERVLRPFSGRDHRVLRALDGVSFEIRQGEFFGIVGRNGSGKSTLLKLLASIYRADSGTIRMAGRLAPFIELGVGFNHELTARENVVLNGVMMGLSPQETRRRLDAIVEFAELGEFVDLKLKNYSSGMLVRLAFSLMLEVDADIMLIDEVLAVGDASFQQKCVDAFHEMKGKGKTIVLVTHEMETVEDFCHRAMLIDDGEIDYLGDPGEVGRRYMRLNFDQQAESGEHRPQLFAEGDEVRLLDAWIENDGGERLQTLEHGEEIRLRLRLEAQRQFPGLFVGFIVANADGVPVFQFDSAVTEAGQLRPIEPGERIQVEATLANPLNSGRYSVHCGVSRAEIGGVALYVQNAVNFLVFGGPSSRGLVDVKHQIEATVEGSA